MTNEKSSFKVQYGWSVAALLPITPIVANFFHKRHFSADFVSVLSLVVFLPGLWIYYYYGDYRIARLITVFLFAVGTLLDIVDGYLARISGSGSLLGAYLDAGIDLIRYNLFFFVLWLLEINTRFDSIIFICYVGLLNASFVKLYFSIRGQKPKAEVNTALNGLLPRWYSKFCLRNKLLFNPFSLEDQLLLYLFTLGILLHIELPMLIFCTSIRVLELAIFASIKLGNIK